MFIVFLLFSSNVGEDLIQESFEQPRLLNHRSVDVLELVAQQVALLLHASSEFLPLKIIIAILTDSGYSFDSSFWPRDRFSKKECALSLSGSPRSALASVPLSSEGTLGSLSRICCFKGRCFFEEDFFLVFFLLVLSTRTLLHKLQRGADAE